MSIFNSYAPRIMRGLMKDLGLERLDAAAIVGNLAHECGGFEKMQEMKPVVRGSRGGYGWAQWTGPRRRQFERFAQDRGLNPAGYEANYAFLVWELRGPYRGVLKSTRAARGIDEKVKAFELGYERAGVKHYASRTRWAKRALALYDGMQVVDGAKSALSREEIRAAQHRLRELGYYEVGRPDGEMGTRTIGAITAFQAYEGLDRTGEFDAPTLERLSTASPRPVSEERAALTLADLRTEGSETIKQTDAIKKTSWLQGIFGFFGMIFAAMTDFFGQVWEDLSELRYVFGQIPVWVWFGLAFAVSVYMWWRAEKTQERRLEDERTGKHAGTGD